MEKNKEEKLKVRKVHSIEERIDNEADTIGEGEIFSKKMTPFQFKNKGIISENENVGFQGIINFDKDFNPSSNLFQNESLIVRAGHILKSPLNRVLLNFPKKLKNEKHKRHSSLSKNFGKRIEDLSCSARDLSLKIKDSDFCLKF